MISPSTPPGTPVVCIDASPGPYGLSMLEKGAYYTVAGIVDTVAGKGCLLEEIPTERVSVAPWGFLSLAFALSRFRYLDIPPALLSLQAERVLEDV